LFVEEIMRISKRSVTAVADFVMIALSLAFVWALMGNLGR
jgi:hypothetical protein